MYIIVAIMEEIDDEDDLFYEFDVIFSSIELDSSCPIYELHVLL